MSGTGITLPPPKCHLLGLTLHVCGDADVKKPAGLPVHTVHSAYTSIVVGHVMMSAQ